MAYYRTRQIPQKRFCEREGYPLESTLLRQRSLGTCVRSGRTRCFADRSPISSPLSGDATSGLTVALGSIQ